MKKNILSILLCIIIAGCNNSVKSPQMVDSYPSIYPDYINTYIPYNIAPLNFDITEDVFDCVDVAVKGNKGKELHINGKKVSFSEDEWHNLLHENKGDSIFFTVSIKKSGKWKQYKPFSIHISKDAIDKYLTYRLIAPGYEIYSKMGIYQRDLTNFQQKAILENTLVTNMCINCHSFNRTDPKQTSIHIRGEHGATIMINNGKTEYLNTKTDSTISACVYPYWHPSGDYIAYSTNKTLQGFHIAEDERIEVFDLASDIVVYHPKTHELITSPLLKKPDVFETFPVFSTDGKTLYFCAAEKKEIPSQYKEIRYNLCSISFNPDNGTFGNKIDTLVNAVSDGKSISFPRPSYDGKYIMYTLSDYGNFSIWHKEADLWLYNIKENKAYPMTNVNSRDTESFHNWSSNSKWFVFSSRRDDGLYTRLYISGLDDKGDPTKPFMLPQKNPYNFYQNLYLSYNVPDFTSSPLKINTKETGKMIYSKNRTNINIRK